MSTLLPEGVRSLLDAPFHLQDAIVAALHFLSLEKVPDEDRPPKRIWLDADAMKSHWEDVQRREKARMGVDGEKQIEGPVEENEAAKDLLIG